MQARIFFKGVTIIVSTKDLFFSTKTLQTICDELTSITNGFSGENIDDYINTDFPSGRLSSLHNSISSSNSNSLIHLTDPEKQSVPNNQDLVNLGTSIIDDWGTSYSKFVNDSAYSLLLQYFNFHSSSATVVNVRTFNEFINACNRSTGAGATIVNVTAPITIPSTSIINVVNNFGLIINGNNLLTVNGSFNVFTNDFFGGIYDSLVASITNPTNNRKPLAATKGHALDGAGQFFSQNQHMFQLHKLLKKSLARVLCKGCGKCPSSGCYYNGDTPYDDFVAVALSKHNSNLELHYVHHSKLTDLNTLLQNNAQVRARFSTRSGSLPLLILNRVNFSSNYVPAPNSVSNAQLNYPLVVTGQRVLILNNNFSNTHQYALLRLCTGVAFNNEFRSTNGGFWLYGCNSLLVKDCFVNNHTNAGCWVRNSYNILIDNLKASSDQSYLTNGDGCTIWESMYVTLRNSNFTETNCYGLWVNNSESVNIYNNTWLNCITNGIYVDKSEMVNIHSNTLGYFNQSHALMLDAESSIYNISNNMFYRVVHGFVTPSPFLRAFINNSYQNAFVKSTGNEFVRTVF